MKKVLIVGPSVSKSFGGMVTVEKQLLSDKILNAEFDIQLFETYIDGNALKRTCFSLLRCFLFWVKSIYKKYDIFHFQVASNMSTYRKMLLSNLVLKSHGRYIVHIHGADYVDFFNSQSKRRQKKIRSFLTNASVVIVLSEYWKKRFARELGIDNCIVINNCIDFGHYAGFIHFDKKVVNFLFLGRIGKRKGIWDLIDAVQELSESKQNFIVNVAGDGEKDLFLKSIKEKKLEDKFHYYGWVDSFEKDQLFKKCDVLVLPSYNEGLPMSILESMASGLAIISTNVGGIPEVVKTDINGYLINPGDKSQLLTAMSHCMDSSIIAVFKKNNQEVISKKFDIKMFESDITYCYERTLKNAL